MKHGTPLKFRLLNRNSKQVRFGYGRFSYVIKDGWYVVDTAEGSFPLESDEFEQVSEEEYLVAKVMLS